MILTDQQIRQHLLGHARLDDELLTGRQARLQLEIAESNLIDEYAMAEMSSTDRRHFEQNFLITDDRRERLAMARGVVRMAARRRTRRWLVSGGGAAAAAIAIGVFVLRSDPQPYTLDPNSQRGAAAPLEIELHNAPQVIVLRLNVPEPPPPCIATLTRIGDPVPVATIQVPQRDLPYVQLALDKSTLTPGDFSVSLQSGTLFQQDFVFRASR